MNIPLFVTLIIFIKQIYDMAVCPMSPTAVRKSPFSFSGCTLTEKLWGNSYIFAEKYLTLASRKNIYNA